MVWPMRAAFILADVLAAEPDGLATVKGLAEAGLAPVVLFPHHTEGERVESLGLPHVACRPGDAECWGDQPLLLLDASAEVGVAVGDAFLVCRTAEDVARGAAAGCRPVLVLGSRGLDDVFGPGEPEHKEVAVAPDLASAVRYMTAEADEVRRLGPFAYAPHPVMEEVALPRALSSGDLTKLFATLTVAAIAVALGIAYLLQEVYQRVHLPPISWYLTLQFIPQTWRGVMFILVGVGLGLMVPRLLAGMRARRNYR
jgi:hypothetical protein